MKAIVFVLIFAVAFAAVQGEAICNLCTGLLTTLEGIIEKKGETHLKTYLETLCAKADGFVQSLCNKIVDFGVDKLIGMLLDKIDPQAICTSIHAC